MSLESILSEIKEERAYQDGKWGTDFDDKNTANDWIAYIVKYAGMAVTMPWDEKEFRTKTLKVAALAVAAIECLERNSGMPSRHYDD